MHYWNAGRRRPWIGAGIRAFTVTMWVIVLIAFGAALDQIGHANALVDCKHRGYAHIDHHGGKLEDDRYHLLHHERPTCEHDKHEGKADEAEHEVHESEHDAKRAEHDHPREHHRNKLGPHRDPHPIRHHLF